MTTATYNRWKYMMEKNLPIPLGLSTTILDQMQGDDTGEKYPILDLPYPGETEEAYCPYCGKHVATYKKINLLEFHSGGGGSFLPLGYHRNCPSSYQQLDWVKAIFQPTGKTPLKPECKQYVDRPFMFQASWILESGSYKGQWAFMPYTMDKEPIIGFGWVPQEDLNVYHKF